jgi:4-azaleucine resistance transporter AzlC
MKSHHFTEGLQRTFPLFIGVIPFGLAYGISAKTAGLSLFHTVFMSLFVFAGASQFIAVELMRQKAWAAAIIITTLVVNLRHILMSLSLKPWLDRYGLLPRLAAAFGIIDETYAVSSIYFAERREGFISFLFASAVMMYAGWAGSSLAGYLLGAQISDPLKWGLDFAMPATFIGILIPQLKSRTIVCAVAASAASAVAFKLWLHNPMFILFGALIGASAGYALEKRRQWTR